MSESYICWRQPAVTPNWTVLRIGPNGEQVEILSFERYLDAAKLVRQLRAGGLTVH